MPTGRFPTVADQVFAELRQGILAGRWRGTLPGRHRLAAELGVNHKTVEAAVRRLEEEGAIVSQGGTRRRRIVLSRESVSARKLRVRILSYDREDRAEFHNAALIDQLQRAGFTANFSVKSLRELGMDPRRVARFVEKTDADAWIVCAGSREVLEWFSQQPIPAIAMFGRFSGLPIAAASPRIAPAMIQAVRRLFALGHRRMVMLVGEARRRPFPALFERKFLDELESLGIPTGPFNLPDWKDSPEGLRACLDSLFRHTPPTALIFGENRFFAAAQQHLAKRGIFAPDQVSMITSDPEQVFDWSDPRVSHFRWDHRPVIRRVTRWVENVAKGKEDKRQVMFDGEFVEGGMIGPPAKGIGGS